jgi:hypothetical protein
MAHQRIQGVTATAVAPFFSLAIRFSGHPPDFRRDLWHLIVLIDLMNSTFTVTIIS